MTGELGQDPLSNHLHEVTDLVRRGNFAKARRFLREKERQTGELNRMRLRALRRPLDVDTAAWVVFGLMAVVLMVLAVMTLLH